jgi:hypothetical protein
MCAALGPASPPLPIGSIGVPGGRGASLASGKSAVDADHQPAPFGAVHRSLRCSRCRGGAIATRRATERRCGASRT